MKLLPILVVGFGAACASPATEFAESSGGWSDIDVHLSRLANSPDDAILIITVQGSEDFVQFSASEGVVEMDLPLVTSRQTSLEPEYLSFFETWDRPVVSRRGSNGARFLDVEFRDETAQLIRVTKALLQGVFGAETDARFKFESQDIGAAP